MGLGLVLPKPFLASRKASRMNFLSMVIGEKRVKDYRPWAMGN
jgi:hypothetical protein